MSIDLNWDTVTTGPDGQVLARKIRDFIHGKFQEISLPRFIKSVTVHDFDFGTIPPELEIKDITDPLPDFYEENSDLDDAGDEADDADDGGSSSTRAGPGPDLAGRDSDPFDDLHVPDGLRAAAERRLHAVPPHLSLPGGSGFKSATPLPQQDLGSPFLGVSTPGIPGGTSNLHYFHSQFATGLSGTQTPLAALASAQHMSGGRLESTASARDLRERLRADHGGGGGISSAGQSRGRSRNLSQSSVGDYIPAVNGGSSGLAAIHGSSSFASGLGLGIPIAGGSSYLIHPTLREKHSVSTLAPTSVGASRPPTRAGVVIAEADGGGGDFGHDAHQYMEKEAEPEAQQQRRFREPRIEDIQAVFRIKYAGNIKLLLTADILLDYPMPSFVGIPVQLSITGVTFDGVGVVAYIRKRVHFCFLSPEDALAAVGGEGTGSGAGSDSQGAAAAAAEGKPPNPPGRLGGLLQEIRVESEIGQREGGKQSLKNVGKVERFVLEQVRRILEEEFVYPSFWTVLV